MIRYLDMFAGIGGFRSALERVGGFKCVAYCEIDKYAKKAYEAMYNTEGEIYFNDARTINPEELPDIDLICGGFPCQTFSIAGKRAGFEDTRGTLFFEIARIAAVKKPKYLLLENVPGLLSHNSGRTFAAILGTLDELGYDVAWQVLNSADHNVPQSRKRVYIVGFLRGKCAGRILSFTDANPKTLVQRIPGKQGDRIYSIFGLSITLTSQAGGFAGDSPQCGEMSRSDRGDGRVAQTGLYEIMGLPIKSNTKLGYQAAFPGDSIDLGYADMNTRRGRVGKNIAHTLTTSNTQGYYFVYCFDLNPQPKITELARCTPRALPSGRITTRQDNGFSKRKGEKSGVIFISAEPIAVLTPERENKRQEGRRFKLPGEPMFTITVADRHGVVYMGYIRKLIPLECWRLQGFTDEQFNKVRAVGMSDAQLYKQAGNAVTVNVVEAVARFILEIERECYNGEHDKNI